MHLHVTYVSNSFGIATMCMAIIFVAHIMYLSCKREALHISYYVYHNNRKEKVVTEH